MKSLRKAYGSISSIAGMRWLALSLLLASVLISVTPMSTALAAGYVVNAAGDGPDTNPADGVCQASNGKCTLRAAIEQANASVGPDTITFNLGTAAISPATDLPHLTDNGTTIRGDGTITLDGSSPQDFVGLAIEGSSNNKIQGLTIQNFGEAGIVILAGSNNVIGVDGDGSTDDNHERNVIGDNYAGILMGKSSGNVIAGNYIGVGPGGNGAKPNNNGIVIGGQSNDNRVGTNADGISDIAERNVISGNIANGPFTGGGVYIADGSENVIAGNFIGTNAAGTGAIPNDYGVAAAAGPGGTVKYNIIGVGGAKRPSSAEQNVISGNNLAGVALGGFDNIVAGNLIGTRANGTQALGNKIGIEVSDPGSNLIGTDADGVSDDLERNVISGNGTGITFENGTTLNIVAGNYIGTRADGTQALGNQGDGVLIQDTAHGNQIGINAGGAGKAAERNVISGNGGNGVEILGGEYNTVGGNFIGTDASGAAALGNKKAGILFNGGNNNFAGWHVPQFSFPSGNMIAFNTGNGVEVVGKETLNNQILSNSIFSNGKLGIDLDADGVTLNDSPDSDEGGNHLANFPIPTTALSNGSQIGIEGKVSDGLPKSELLIQFFASDACDGSGHGEGQRFIGQAYYDLSQLGTDFTFNEVFATAVPPGSSFITLTGTWFENGIDGNTSEFSECIKVDEGAPKR